MAIIDTEKVALALDYVTEKDQGRELLSKFREQIDDLKAGIQPGLNDSEFVLVLRTLVGGLRLDQPAEKASGEELADSDLEAVAGGLSTRDLLSGRRLTRLGSGLQNTALTRRIAGFNVRMVN